MIDAAPVNTFPPGGDVSLAPYPAARAKIDRAAERYLKRMYDISERRAYVAGAFSRSLQTSLHDVLNVKLGAKTIDYQILDGMASITIWKRGKEYFAVAQSEIIYPGADGIYSYYELRRKDRKSMSLDELPTDIFQSRVPAKLSDYVDEQAAMHRALATYLDGKYEVIDYRLHLSGSFGRVIKSCLYDFFVHELHAKKVSSRWPDGLSSVTIWKSGRQFTAVVVSEMIPGDKAIYGYFALRKQ